MPYDAIIVGGGSSGMSAGIYLAQHKWRTLILDGNWKENQSIGRGTLPIFPGATAASSSQIISDSRKYFEKLGGIFDESDVKKINILPKMKQVSTARGDAFTAQAIIVANGITPHTSYFSGERRLLGHGLSYDIDSAILCGTKKAVIVGKCESAAKVALRLADSLTEVTFIIPANRIDIPDELWQEIKNKRPKLKTLFSASLKNIKGNDRVEAITIFSQGNEEIIPTDTVILYSHEFVAKTDFLPETVERSSNGEIMVDETFATSLPSIFAVGDVICGVPQFPLISSAQGIIAGQSAEKLLLEV